MVRRCGESDAVLRNGDAPGLWMPPTIQPSSSSSSMLRCSSCLMVMAEDEPAVLQHKCITQWHVMMRTQSSIPRDVVCVSRSTSHRALFGRDREGEAVPHVLPLLHGLRRTGRLLLVEAAVRGCEPHFRAGRDLT